MLVLKAPNKVQPGMKHGKRGPQRCSCSVIWASPVGLKAQRAGSVHAALQNSRVSPCSDITLTACTSAACNVRPHCSSWPTADSWSQYQLISCSTRGPDMLQLQQLACNTRNNIIFGGFWVEGMTDFLFIRLLQYFWPFRSITMDLPWRKDLVMAPDISQPVPCPLDQPQAWRLASRRGWVSCLDTSWSLDNTRQCKTVW